MAWLLRPKKNAGPHEAVQVPGADSAQAVGEGAGNGATVGSESSAASSSPAPGVPSSPSNGVVVKPPEEVSEYIEDPKFVALKRELHQEVIAQLDPVAIGKASPEQLRAEVRRQAEILCRSRKDLLTSAEHERLIKEVMDEAFGLGPLEQLLSDPDISDILINGPKMIYIEKKGRLQRTHVTFHDDRHLVQIVQRIAAQIGRRVDEMSPMVDARLADGSRLNAVIAPVALDGALVSIRRFGATPLHLQKLVENQSITQEMVDFLIASVKARANIIISGGTGSGKTTLLNSLSRYIPEDERVATIEDAAELRLQQPHVVRMETRTANLEGLGEITTRDLVRNALRMRPDRILIGECRGAEALDMLQAMNTGHEGSLTTIHANTTRDGVSRLEMMASMAGFDMPIWVIRKQIASAVNIILQVSRLSGGVRKVTRISEITGMEGEVISMQDIFEFRQTGLNSDRVAIGQFAATGIRPSIINRIHSYGIDLSNEMFEKRVLMDCKGRV
jgi:pilus assembly protein CpaF